MPAVRHVRRLHRGAVSVELDYDDAHVLLRCDTHQIVERVPLRRDGLGPLLIEFFRDHQSCSLGAPFDLDDATGTTADGDMPHPPARR